MVEHPREFPSSTHDSLSFHLNYLYVVNIQFNSIQFNSMRGIPARIACICNVTGFERTAILYVLTEQQALRTTAENELACIHVAKQLQIFEVRSTFLSKQSSEFRP
jgi:hypothetical protein